MAIRGVGVGEIRRDLRKIQQYARRICCDRISYLKCIVPRPYCRVFLINNVLLYVNFQNSRRRVDLSFHWKRFRTGGGLVNV